MNFLDYSSLLTGDPAILALFSTFQFDPDFFERRLMKCSALKKARRIAVFMDAGQWQRLLQSDVLSRAMNRRYLVVPVRRGEGVFHPKLNLLLTEMGGQIQCGSNNLTRSGCSSNLELLNSLPFEFASEDTTVQTLAKQSLSFFDRAAQETDEEIGRIVRGWIAEVQKGYPWPKQDESFGDPPIRLVHTYDGPIWDRLLEVIGESQPHEIFVVSPFHDADGRICCELANQWPKAKVELLVQQGYTTLPVSPIRKLRSFRLAEIQDASRRLHAKLLAWKGRNSSGCLVGSPNFTSAAFTGKNVEVALLLADAWPMVEKLFDSKLKKRPLPLDDFEPGEENPPESEEWALPLVSVSSAILIDSNHIRITFQHRFETTPQTLWLAVRTPGESNPRLSIPLPKGSQGKETVGIPDGKLSDAYGTLLASVIADVGDKRFESPPVWIVQEERLTHEPGEGTSSSKTRIETTGEGLPEYLDEIGNREGIAAIAEYLRNLNIRFYDGGSGGRGAPPFRVRITDPFESDRIPDWLIHAKTESNDLGDAILDFVRRHDKQKLHKHVSRGNINGMENFLDILTALVRLLYVYYKRGIVKRGVLIGWLCDWIELTTSGRDTEEDSFDGYLYSLWDSLGGDVSTLRKVCSANHYCANIRAILLIAQKVRYLPGEVPKFGKPPQSQKDVLKQQASIIQECFSECDLNEPSPDDVQDSLDRYQVLSPEEIGQMLLAL